MDPTRPTFFESKSGPSPKIGPISNPVKLTGIADHLEGIGRGSWGHGLSHPVRQMFGARNDFPSSESFNFKNRENSNFEIIKILFSFQVPKPSKNFIFEVSIFQFSAI